MGCCASKKKLPFPLSSDAPLVGTKDPKKYPENTDPTQGTENEKIKLNQVYTESSKNTKKTTQTNEKAIRSARVTEVPKAKEKPLDKQVECEQIEWQKEVRAKFVEPSDPTQDYEDGVKKEGVSKKEVKKEAVVKEVKKEAVKAVKNEIKSKETIKTKSENVDQQKAGETVHTKLPSRTQGSSEPTPEIAGPRGRPSAETM
ncbi:hypothetical protein M3Y95_00964700 [Aphelenchoides besseyi]|nr:hypothetical protein M3Y95_00964700 [Aphelenchoides besseyi]